MGQNLKITHIINATLKYQNAFETFEPHWNKIMEFMKCIDSNNQNRMFVHCEMGISRSATICIAYLMNKRKMTLYDAYFYVMDKRSIIRPNSSFLKQLEKYEKLLFNQASTLKRVEQEIRQRYFQKLSSEQQGI